MSDAPPISKHEKADRDGPIALRVTCPGGLKVTVDVDPSATTVGDLKTKLSESGAPPASYLRLVCRGKKLDDEDATLSSLGLEHRTALMALHNAAYAQDLEGITAIEKILKEAETLKDPSLTEDVVRERITLLCCQLDNVDTNGSTALRQYRKSALAQVQGIEDI